MAQADFILDLDGVEGECADAKYPKKIQLLSFGFGVTNTGGAGYGSGAGTSKSLVQDMHFTKLVDTSSPNLFQAAATGKHFKTAILHVRKAGGDQPVEYMLYTLNEVFVSAHNITGHDGGGMAQESGSLNFSKIQMDYKLQSATGAGDKVNTKGYDVTANKPF
jgi:type VI secretion system secreted protein Hcp